MCEFEFVVSIFKHDKHFKNPSLYHFTFWKCIKIDLCEINWHFQVWTTISRSVTSRTLRRMRRTSSLVFLSETCGREAQWMSVWGIHGFAGYPLHSFFIPSETTVTYDFCTKVQLIKTELYWAVTRNARSSNFHRQFTNIINLTWKNYW